MTGRDRIALIVVLSLGLTAAFWMLMLNPKRKEAAKLGQAVAGQQERLDTARAEVRASQAAQGNFAADYAAVAQLGKAVPTDDDMPSLVYQLESAASRTGVDFRTIKLKEIGRAHV